MREKSGISNIMEYIYREENTNEKDEKMSEYKNQIRAEREKRHIENVIDWLFVPEGELRHTFLTHAERIAYMKTIIERIAYVPYYIRERLITHWMWVTVNKIKDKESAASLVRKAVQEVYATSHLEAWAESRLIKMLKKDKNITPMRMAIEYCRHAKDDQSMAGIYVRDMQRVSARVKARWKRAGMLEKTDAKERVQQPRLRRTKRQEQNYADRAKKKVEGGDE